MGKIIHKIPSISRPGRSYNITRGDDGVIYCDCWQWKIHNDCKHLKQYLALQKTSDGVVNAAVDRSELEIAIEETVRTLKEGR